MGRLVAIDTETWLIQPGRLIPKLVCGSFSDGEHHVLLPYDATLDKVELHLRSDDILAGANIAYDFAVVAVARPALLPLIWAKYDRGEVHDIELAQALDAIAKGTLLIDPTTGGPLKGENGKVTNRYSLWNCVRLVLGRTDAKANDAWRLRYAELDGVPMDQWPDEAKIYPLDDARNTWEVAAVQRADVGLGDPHANLDHLPRECKVAWALHLACAWGLRTDSAAVEEFAKRVETQSAEHLSKYLGTDILRADGTRDMTAIKRRVLVAYGAKDPCPTCGGSGRVASLTKAGKPTKNGKACEPCSGTGLKVPPGVPPTDSGGISTSRDTLLESGDDFLEGFGKVSENEKLKDTYLPFVRSGTQVPITLRANPILESDRTSYDGLIQLLPRKGGVRDCFVPRKAKIVEIEVPDDYQLQPGEEWA